jgi:post-segregation antitoxin (ccd killing protein)
MHQLLASGAVATTRTTFTLDDSLAEQARRLGVNVSAAAREGVAAAVRAALAQADRRAYQDRPEVVDTAWADVETWGDG